MKLRVMSYNTQSGFANGRKIHDFRPQADHIASYSPDVIALQEVSIRHPKGEQIDYPAEVAGRLGMNYIFGKAMDLPPNGIYGVAILSKYPLELVDSLILPVPEGIEPRPALIVKVNAPTPFYMISTHLSYQGEFDGDAEGRVKQLESIMAHLERKQLAPVILAGDLNSASDDDSIKFLRKKFEIFSDKNPIEPTCSTKFGWLQIDFIAGFPQGKFTCNAVARGNDCTVSDHYAVIADLEL